MKKNPNLSLEKKGFLNNYVEIPHIFKALNPGDKFSSLAHIAEFVLSFIIFEKIGESLKIAIFVRKTYVKRRSMLKLEQKTIKKIAIALCCIGCRDLCDDLQGNGEIMREGMII